MVRKIVAVCWILLADAVITAVKGFETALANAVKEAVVAPYGTLTFPGT